MTNFNLATSEKKVRKGTICKRFPRQYFKLRVILKC